LRLLAWGRLQYKSAQPSGATRIAQRSQYIAVRLETEMILQPQVAQGVFPTASVASREILQGIALGGSE
jgi:hypothetical protein